MGLNVSASLTLNSGLLLMQRLSLIKATEGGFTCMVR